MAKFEVVAKTVVNAGDEVGAIAEGRKIFKNFDMEIVCSLGGLSNIRLDVKRISDKYTNVDLKKIISNILVQEKTVSEIWEILDTDTDEYEILKIIGELEREGVIANKGYKPIWREDGGVIYLALYKRV